MRLSFGIVLLLLAIFLGSFTIDVIREVRSHRISGDLSDRLLFLVPLAMFIALTAGAIILIFGTEYAI